MCGPLTQLSENVWLHSVQVLDLLFDEVFKDPRNWSQFAKLIDGSRSVSESTALKNTCLQFVPLWNFLVGLFLIKLSGWFPVMSIQLSN